MGDGIFSGKNVFKLKHDINDIHVVCIHTVYIYNYIYGSMLVLGNLENEAFGK